MSHNIQATSFTVNNRNFSSFKRKFSDTDHDISCKPYSLSEVLFDLELVGEGDARVSHAAARYLGNIRTLKHVNQGARMGGAALDHG